jgi:hypothetical protein
VPTTLAPVGACPWGVSRGEVRSRGAGRRGGGLALSDDRTHCTGACAALHVALCASAGQPRAATHLHAAGADQRALAAIHGSHVGHAVRTVGHHVRWVVLGAWSQVVGAANAAARQDRGSTSPVRPQASVGDLCCSRGDAAQGQGRPGRSVAFTGGNPQGLPTESARAARSRHGSRRWAVGSLPLTWRAPGGVQTCGPAWNSDGPAAAWQAGTLSHGRAGRRRGARGEGGGICRRASQAAACLREHIRRQASSAYSGAWPGRRGGGEEHPLLPGHAPEYEEGSAGRGGGVLGVLACIMPQPFICMLPSNCWCWAIIGRPMLSMRCMSLTALSEVM